MPRASHENLLNNLKEGVFIIKEETDLLLFQNTAAKRLNTRLKERSFLSFIDLNENFDKSQEQFALVDYEKVFKDSAKNLNYTDTIKYLEDCNDYVSVEKIIEDQDISKYKGKLVFKMKEPTPVRPVRHLSGSALQS